MGPLIQIAPACTPQQASLFAETEVLPRYTVALTPEVKEMLGRNCVVAIGVSGGKDSQACAVAVARYLDSIKHTGPRLLIHADLGLVEWEDSLPTCERLAQHLGMELAIVRRKNGGMMERWEQRWASNVSRYEDLNCVKLILPWSTPGMRFCTSELKVSPISQELRRRFPKDPILNVTGIRRTESDKRKLMPVSEIEKKLQRKGSDLGITWNAIIEWGLGDVFRYVADVGLQLHEAYTKYHTTRVSCVFCIMGSKPDIESATTCERNHAIYVRMVELEATSTFKFKDIWLADVAPHLLSESLRQRIGEAKLKAVDRQKAEKLLPSKLFFTKGWPTSIPSLDEADLIAEVRKRVSDAVGLNSKYLTAASVRDRYAELYETKHGSLLLPPQFETEEEEAA
jgi:3'-phosphoadenosine 5'-phosphosulfate sulfotransferase (PAPS reductase)/FAD synthetase